MKNEKAIFVPVKSGKLKAKINYSKYGNYKDKKTLIIAHGFMGSIDGGGSASNLADSVSDLVNVLRFQFSNSEKLSNRVLELKEVVEFVKKNINKNIILLGRSLGGAASMIVASEDEDVLALSLWATPRSFKLLFSTVLGNENYEQVINGKVIDIQTEKGCIMIEPDLILDAYKYDLIKFLKKWNARPILLLHGVNDQLVNISEAKKNYEDINSKNKKIVVLKNCGHSFKDCDSETIKATKDWLRGV